METSQRKLLSNLRISGTALMAFGVLDVIKFIIYRIMDPSIQDLFGLLFLIDRSKALFLMFFILGVLLLEVVLYLVVYLGAKAESKGKKQNVFYVVVAVLLVIIEVCGSIFSIVSSFLDGFSVGEIIESFISAILSCAVVYILLDIIVSSIKNRKIIKQLEKQDQTAISQTNAEEAK